MNTISRQRPYGDTDPQVARPAEAGAVPRVEVAGEGAPWTVDLGTRRALLRVGAWCLVLCVAAAVTYLSPALERWRPWVSGEAIPLSGLVQMKGGQPLPGFAEAGQTQQSSEEIAEQLGSAVAAGLSESPAPEVSPRAGRPLFIDPSEIADVEVPIEFPERLNTFFEALERSARDQPGAITRVAHYGDSAVAADGITSTARRLLQQRFGDSGHGFVLASRGRMFYGHRGIRLRSSKNWRMYSMVRRALGLDWYGYGGVQGRARAGAVAHFETDRPSKPVGTRASRFEVFYQKHSKGARLRLGVDGDVKQTLVTRASSREDAFYSLRVPDGPHRFTLGVSGGGQAHVYGVALERDEPGVVYDSLGLVGARVSRLLNSEPAHFASQLAHRSPDLLVLAFGGNESINRYLNLADLERDMTRVVRQLKGSPQQRSCLVFAPMDHGERDRRGRVITAPILPRIIEVQRKVARAEGCAFFDAWTAMGGEGTMGRWLRSRPRLAKGDLRHATRAGYRVVGTLYYRALLDAFAQHLR